MLSKSEQNLPGIPISGIFLKETLRNHKGILCFSLFSYDSSRTPASCLRGGEGAREPPGVPPYPARKVKFREEFARGYYPTVIFLELLGPSELFVEIIFARPLENIKIRIPPSGFGPPLVDSVCGSPLAGFPGQPHCSSAKHEESDTKPLGTVPPPPSGYRSWQSVGSWD